VEPRGEILGLREFGERAHRKKKGCSALKHRTSNSPLACVLDEDRVPSLAWMVDGPSLRGGRNLEMV
jgi:hypothetical protein